MERIMSDPQRPSLGTIIDALHDSEINGEVSWFYDGVWTVKLGDEYNGGCCRQRRRGGRMASVESDRTIPGQRVRQKLPARLRVNHHDGASLISRPEPPPPLKAGMGLSHGPGRRRR